MKRPGKPRGQHYLSHQAVDTDNGIILDVTVTPGDVNDSVPYLEQIERINSQIIPLQAAAADVAYDFPLAHRVLDDLGIAFFVRHQKHGDNSKTEFKHDDFRYDEENDLYVCPQGNPLRRNILTRTASGLYWQYIAQKADCKDCPLRHKCLSETDRRGARKLEHSYFRPAVSKHLDRRGEPVYQDAPMPVYETLLKLIADKDYFVITTNVDHCFQKAGFDKKRLFYTQGDYGLFQCSEPCCQETFDNEAVIREMVKRQEDMKVPTELLPVCPHCGKPLTMNLRSDNKFVEDEGWHRAAERYENFLRTREGQKILFLELGVGYNTPVIIKYPFWQMTAKNPDATYACINQGQAVCSQEIEQRSICMNADTGQILQNLSDAAIQ